MTSPPIPPGCASPFKSNRRRCPPCGLNPIHWIGRRFRLIPHKGEVRKQYSVDTSDIGAVGIVSLAIAAAFVAAVVALGFVFGKVKGADTVKIVGTCVGGSTISGVVAALVGRKSKPTRRA